MHNQNDDIKSNIEKIKDYPIFHAGPIIRREYPFDNMEMKDRKKIFQSIFMFTLLLPIKIFSFDRGLSSTFTPFICLVWAFFLFKRHFFKLKIISKHF